MTFKAWFDGGCFPNPGGTATFGYVVKKGGEIAQTGCGIVGNGPRMTNNVAEYKGLIECMTFFINHGLNRESISFFGDSALVIKQMNGDYRLPSPKAMKKPYAAYAYEAAALRDKFTASTFQWIPREENVEADALTNTARAVPDSTCVG